MSKLLTKKGAEQILDHAGRLAHVVEHNWEALGIPSEKHAKDLAYRLDLLQDTIERTASENEAYDYDPAKISVARAKQAEETDSTVGEGTLSDDEGSKLRDGAPEQDNMTTVQNGYDPSDIGKLKAPERKEPDEPYMDAFTQDEYHQLADLQQSGEFSNSKASKDALGKAALALAQAAAVL